MGRPPSSASSVARSSDGRMGFGGPPGQRDSARSNVNPHNEDALQRHYGALKTYLAPSLQNADGSMKPNRARDKLLRLSVTQFMELSTDVFDELMRREDERLQRVRDVPRFLPPKQNFHPKRNQARQKLSTLPIERFRQLATDVFYELERRIPRFVGSAIDRPMSGASNRAPSRGGMRPPPGFRGPPPPMSPGVGPPGKYGRPLPKTFQSNTIVPNKSTMVEDDEDEFGLDDVVGDRFSKNTDIIGPSNAEDKEKIKAREAEIAELKEKIEGLENRLLDKEQELESVKGSAQDRDVGVSRERDDWFSLREELEQKHTDAQRLNDNLRRELDQLHNDKTQDEREIRSQHDRNLADLRFQVEQAHGQSDELHRQLETHQAENDGLHRQLQTHRAESEELRNQLAQGQQHTTSNSEYERRIEFLQEELANQEKLTNEVRNEATMYLREMRDLSKQNDEAIEQEEKLAAQVSKLEKDNDEWRQRYAKVKAQNKSLRASTLGLGLQTSFDSGSLQRKEALLSEGGLVKDVDVTRFQMSVDELLKVARQSSTEAMLDSVKKVVVCVQSITSAVGTDGYPTPSPSPLSPGGNVLQQSMPVSKLKARVTGTANSLITATKQHASASGLSPVALLDAAASNLTSSVVELVKAVGIRPSPKSELEDAEVDDHHDSMSSFYDDRLSEERSPPQIAVQIDPPEARPAPLSLGRSNTMKKVNGWFGWGSKTSEEPPSPTLQTNGHPDEYDPYQ